jgi:hypothetical protein
MRLTTFVTLAVLLAACGGGSDTATPPTESTAETTSTAVPSLDERAELVSYDQSAPLNLVEKMTKTEKDVEVVDLVFDAADRKVSAFLVRPKGKPKAAVLWAHWYGEEANPNRKEFLRRRARAGQRGGRLAPPARVLPLAGAGERGRGCGPAAGHRSGRPAAAGSTCSRSRPAMFPSGLSATTTARCSARYSSPTSGRRRTS